MTRQDGVDVPIKTKTRPWDAAEHLETEEDMSTYLEAAPLIYGNSIL